MEYGLGHQFPVTNWYQYSVVLILVLMEYGLGQQRIGEYRYATQAS